MWKKAKNIAEKPRESKKKEVDKFLSEEVKKMTAKTPEKVMILSSSKETICVQIERSDGLQPATEEAQPDTGASSSCVGLSRIRRLGLEKEITPRNLRLVNASGAQMQVSGVINMSIRDVNEALGRFVVITAIVSPNLKDELLISTGDQKTIGILHKNYPNHNRSEEHTSELQSQ